MPVTIMCNTYWYYTRKGEGVALTVRLSPEAERILNAVARRRRQSRSDVVRDALAQYGAAERAATVDEGPYGAWLDVLGVVSLGVRDPARTTGDQFAAALRRESRARRAR
jgi:Arc/MetJ-type ribon-helix-helix transcriptional regulator